MANISTPISKDAIPTGRYQDENRGRRLPNPDLAEPPIRNEGQVEGMQF
jgi:hypothetical protein